MQQRFLEMFCNVPQPEFTGPQCYRVFQQVHEPLAWDTWPWNAVHSVLTHCVYVVQM